MSALQPICVAICILLFFIYTLPASPFSNYVRLMFWKEKRTDPAWNELGKSCFTHLDLSTAWYRDSGLKAEDRENRVCLLLLLDLRTCTIYQLMTLILAFNWLA